MVGKRDNLSKKKDALSKRPPIVVVLGHVDHGKTTLLDCIRKTQIAATEAGGITQQIGAYQIEKPTKITFIDTPGHEAFSKMRSRGAKVADIAVLVVAADDSVMPQTEESIEYIRQAQIPLIVAINKLDLPTADVKKVKQDLLKSGIACEGYGGEIVAVEISAKTGKGVSEMLEIIGLVAEMENLIADPEGLLEGVIIDSSLDRKRGPLATVLVKKGTLYVRDIILAGNVETRVKALFNEFDSPMTKIMPSEPAVVLGFSNVPPVGSIVTKQQEDKMVKKSKVKDFAPTFIHRNVEQTIAKREKNVMRVVIKAESEGALESVLENLPPGINVLISRVGDITESDIYYAATTKSLVIGFNIKIPAKVQRLAESEKVVVRVYAVIYELLEEIEEAVAELVRGPEEVVIGRAKVLEKFIINEMQIAGLRVEEGKFRVGNKVKVERDSSVSHGEVVSIRHGKIEVKEALPGREYGIGLTGKLDFAKKDVIIAYRMKS